MLTSIITIAVGVACLIFCRPLSRRVANARFTPGGASAEGVALIMWILAGLLLIALGILGLLGIHRYRNGKPPPHPTKGPSKVGWVSTLDGLRWDAPVLLGARRP
jgi:hypothetical protein